MFGYVVVNKSELKFKEYDQYRRYYCGLCRCLKQGFGRKGQIALSYDMTFLVLLLSGLYEPEEKSGTKRCIAHPLKKQEYITNNCSEYAADMTVLLTYYKCMDDYEDEKKLSGKIYAKSLEKQVAKLKEKYPKKIKRIEESMKHFSEVEQEAKKKVQGKKTENEVIGESSYLDKLSDAFGKTLGEIFAVGFSEHDKIWEETLRRIGYSIGNFIYVLDAYDDLERDRKKGCYNPLLSSSLEDLEQRAWIEDVLRFHVANAAREFETLPIVKDAGIMRNILYSGIWSRFHHIGNEKKKEKREK